MLKRLIGLLLAILMIFALVPCVVFAGNEDISTTAGEEAVIPDAADPEKTEEAPPIEETQAPVITGPEEPLAVFAEPVALSDEGGIAPQAYEPVPGNVNEMPAGLGLEVASNNSAPAVGDTVTYTLSPTGTTPSGNSRPLTEFGFKYKYRYGVMQKVDGSWEFIVDPLSQSFQENNVFEFTFTSSNEYRLDFYLLEMYPVAGSDGKQHYSKDKTQTVYITPTGEGKTVEQAADEVAAQCRAALPNGSEYELALWLHDWIIDNCTYDYNATGVLCSAEGVFFYGTGTCAAYRSAYKMLLDRVGIESERCTGNGHEWNAVKLDGKWYQIDPTWDDVDYSAAYSYYRHLYFGLTDALMGCVHSDHSADPARPANSLEQNYFIKTGQIHTWSDGFEEGITEQLKAGNASFSLPVTTSEPDTTKSVLYGIAAYELSSREWTANGKKFSLEAQYAQNVMSFTAKEITETPPTPTPPVDTGYVLANIAALHSGRTLALCIDGREIYPDAGGSFGSIKLAEGEKKLITVSEYNLPVGSDVHVMYPTGMYVYSLTNSGGYVLERVSGLDNLLSYGGSSIRITGNKGIRMITGIESSLKSALTGAGVSGYKLEEYGTLLCWASEIQNGSLSLGDSYARHNYAYSRAAGADPVFRVSGSKIQYTNVLVGFTNAQCVDDIAMRSYIKLSDPDGKQVTLYGGIVRRSIGYIAYQNRGAFAPGTGAYNYIWDIIHYVYGNKYDADYIK